MRVYVVNVNNCEAYSDYYEGNAGVYASREAAVAAMTAQGFNPETQRKKIPWDDQDPNWLRDGYFDERAYRIEEWEVKA